jgi:hypothetical protein
LIALLAVLLGLGTCARADEYRVAEIFAGYSLLNGDLQKRASGWEFGGGMYLSQWLSVHADFAAHHQSAFGSARHEHDLLFGPQFSHRTGRFTPFAHSFFGISHAAGISKDTGFAFVAGRRFGSGFFPDGCSAVPG